MHQLITDLYSNASLDETSIILSVYKMVLSDINDAQDDSFERSSVASKAIQTQSDYC